jgi:hypothetical protein
VEYFGTSQENAVYAQELRESVGMSSLGVVEAAAVIRIEGRDGFSVPRIP